LVPVIGVIDAERRAETGLAPIRSRFVLGHQVEERMAVAIGWRLLSPSPNLQGLAAV
jgi:hypothetical protein